MKILLLLLRGLGKLPLCINHALGAAIGWLAWLCSARLRRRMRENLAQSRLAPTAKSFSALKWQAIAESGKGITELAVAWTATPARIDSLIRRCIGWQHVEAAQQRGKGIIFVTPHLGCYEIAGRYLAGRLPVTALYRPPKRGWLEAFMRAGRLGSGGDVVPANASGVRALLRALRQGASTIVLPDQVPAAEKGGDGVWADFFGRPAYTMTLLPRLVESTGASVLFFFAERLPHGAGYCMYIEPMNTHYSSDANEAARQTNAMVEKLVRLAPAQYLWSYNRYKHPAGAPFPR